MASKKDLLKTLLKGLETGDPASAAVVNEDKYIQHNPQTHEGSEGLAVLFARLAKTSPRVTFKRVFEDGDFAFAHIEYDFSSLRAAFEVFRFEDGKAVEHWDNIQTLRGPNPSGRGMQDGATEITDLDKTEENRALARSYTEQVLIRRQLDQLPDYVRADLIQHNPDLADGLPALRDALSATEKGVPAIQYQHLHRVLAEGNFVLCASEGQRGGIHTSFYDLYRIEDGRIAEHWDTIEAIPPRSEWKNDNGKF
ncbi:nuclear transport factor 2 family protein [Leisingera aquaemixtae]|uniref:nuclear transport factor 2 family protein n=1 Tax=Leisingera aquaemixtae TaxID=1396826 RepID=UPI001C93DB1F|nr:nuclear transport factor 2 family protein [Leisingera aquaemixtae]MBY6066749.1 nuclear transport factor 2 family protein [Leisingera aquaemixtae]